MQVVQQRKPKPCNVNHHLSLSIPLKVQPIVILTVMDSILSRVYLLLCHLVYFLLIYLQINFHFDQLRHFNFVYPREGEATEAR